jgi:hypothetical protein
LITPSQFQHCGLLEGVDFQLQSGPNLGALDHLDDGCRWWCALHQSHCIGTLGWPCFCRLQVDVGSLLQRKAWPTIRSMAGQMLHSMCAACCSAASCHHSCGISAAQAQRFCGTNMQLPRLCRAPHCGIHLTGHPNSNNNIPLSI